jgi:uncharacterized membrane protein
MDGLLFAGTLLAALGAGLMAGNFFAFSAFLMRALGSMKPQTGIAAMQAITAAIKNPLFLAVFFGMAVLTALLGIAAPLRWSEPGAVWLLAGSLFYLNGPFGVTLLRNVPLNNRLAALSPGSAEGANLWKAFQSSWGAWNHVRWIASLAASACFIMALVEGGAPLAARE